MKNSFIPNKSGTTKLPLSTSSPALRIGLLLVMVAFLCILVLKIGRDSPSDSSLPAVAEHSEAKSLQSFPPKSQPLAAHPSVPPGTPDGAMPAGGQVVEATGIIEGHLGQVRSHGPEFDASPRMPPFPAPIPALSLPRDAKVVTTQIPLQPSTPPAEGE